MNRPALSIVMPAYNAGKYIREAISSILAQTFTDFELIVIDDGSTDDSPDIVRSFNDSRIQYYQNERNRGIVYSRNRGLEKARGVYYAPFDADDLATPDKFEKQIRFLETHPGFGMVGSWVRMIDRSGNLLKQKWKLNAPARAIPSIMLFRDYFSQSAIMMQRRAVPAGGYTDGFEIGEDYKMWVDVSREWRVWNLPGYLTFYRIHESSITKSNVQLYREKERELYKYIYEALEIEIDDPLFSMLMIIKNDEEITNIAILNEIMQFLELIFRQNDKLKRYDPAQLARVVFNRWIKVCYKCRKHPAIFLKAVSITPILIRRLIISGV